MADLCSLIGWNSPDRLNWMHASGQSVGVVSS